MGRMEVIFVSLFEHQIRWQSQRDSGKRSNIGTIMILNPIQGGWSLISSSIHYFFEEFLPGLGITVNLDKVLVHMYGMDGGPSLLEVLTLKKNLAPCEKVDALAGLYRRFVNKGVDPVMSFSDIVFPGNKIHCAS